MGCETKTQCFRMSKLQINRQATKPTKSYLTRNHNMQIISCASKKKALKTSRKEMFVHSNVV